MNSIISLEREFFGDDRMVDVEYRLPSDEWEDLEVVAVQVFRQVYWQENGEFVPRYNIVDVLPVLRHWQVQEIAEQIRDELQRRAEQEQLAA